MLVTTLGIDQLHFLKLIKAINYILLNGHIPMNSCFTYRNEVADLSGLYEADLH